MPWHGRPQIDHEQVLGIARNASRARQSQSSASFARRQTPTLILAKLCATLAWKIAASSRKVHGIAKNAVHARQSQSSANIVGPHNRRLSIVQMQYVTHACNTAALLREDIGVARSVKREKH